MQFVYLIMNNFRRELRQFTQMFEYYCFRWKLNILLYN